MKNCIYADTNRRVTALNQIDHRPAGLLNRSEEQQLHKFLDEELPKVKSICETAPLTEHRIRQHFLSRLKEVHNLGRDHLARAHTTQSHHYNLRRREWRCRVGDRVMKWEHPLSSTVKAVNAEVSPKYSGPNTVTKVLSPVAYNVKVENHQTYHRVHVKNTQNPEVVVDAEKNRNRRQSKESLLAPGSTAANRSNYAGNLRANRRNERT